MAAGIVAPTEPAAPVEEAPAEGQEASAEAVVASDLPDDTLLEVETPDGSKQRLTLKQLKADWRHGKASDQKFTEADKKEKAAQKMTTEINRALVSAKTDPRTVIDWVAKETNRDPMDVLVEQLEKATDPKVIDKLAGLLEKKLQAEEAEQKKSPEAREIEKLKRDLEESNKRWSEAEDLRVEQQLFGMVKATLEEAGVKPTPLAAVDVMEMIVEARSQTPPIELTPKEAASIYKEHIRSSAEMLFKPAEGLDTKAKAKATGANGATPASAVDAAKREAKKAEPRVTVVGKGGKKQEDEEPKQRSTLEVLRSVYSGKF